MYNRNSFVEQYPGQFSILFPSRLSDVIIPGLSGIIRQRGKLCAEDPSANCDDLLPGLFCIHLRIDHFALPGDGSDGRALAAVGKPRGDEVQHMTRLVTASSERRTGTSRPPVVRGPPCCATCTRPLSFLDVAWADGLVPESRQGVFFMSLMRVSALLSESVGIFHIGKANQLLGLMCAAFDASLFAFV